MMGLVGAVVPVARARIGGGLEGNEPEKHSAKREVVLESHHDVPLSVSRRTEKHKRGVLATPRVT